MKNDEFTEQCRQFWTEAICQLTGQNPPMTAKWQGLDAIHGSLLPFMTSGRNHAHLPRGGGMDLLSVEYSSEENCLEFSIAEQVAWLVKPDSLTLEYFPSSPIDSFLLLELAALLPCGVYEERQKYCEEVAELGMGCYIKRDVFDQGFLSYDEDGREIPIPTSARLVTRWFGGKILIVSKRSAWNSVPETYDGRHNKMTSDDIRKFIESLRQSLT